MCQASRNPALDAQAGHSQAAKERSKPTDDSIGGHEHRLSFDRSQLEFELPEELIAPFPPPKREDARLLVVSRGDGTLSDEHVGELPELLRPGDLLILNDTKVLPARFSVARKTGSQLTGLFLTEESPGIWRVLLSHARRIRVGETLTAPARIGQDTALQVLEYIGAGEWRLRVDTPENPAQLLDRIGAPPVPPYIQRQRGNKEATETDAARYQTVYARSPGAVAAPTAGLHLTHDLLTRIQEREIEIAYVTLHVGMGTFRPIQTDDLSHHVMHEESFELSPETADAIARCRRRGDRVVAVGTTSVRVLETAAAAHSDGNVRAQTGRTGIFIYPPYRFRAVDALLTNFHVPRSTLLALVMAFADVETIRAAYRHAVAQHYRFFSYGDAMLIC